MLYAESAITRSISMWTSSNQNPAYHASSTGKKQSPSKIFAAGHTRIHLPYWSRKPPWPFGLWHYFHISISKVIGTAEQKGSGLRDHFATACTKSRDHYLVGWTCSNYRNPACQELQNRFHFGPQNGLKSDLQASNFWGSVPHNKLSYMGLWPQHLEMVCYSPDMHVDGFTCSLW